MSVCSTCREDKIAEEFHKDKNKKTGLSANCKICANRISNQKNAQRKLEMTEEEFIEYHRDRKFQRNGITREQFEIMLEKQNYVCAVCFKPQTLGHDLCIDHDHSCCQSMPYCGKCVRGLLCHSCNQALGLLQENVMTINSLASYISRF